MTTASRIVIHDQAYEHFTWDQLGQGIFTLAKQIIDSGHQFDRVIALAKGGLTFSRSLVDFLEVKDVSSFQIEFYTGIGQTAETPVITQSLPVTIKDERVLIFDDVVDKGDTMIMAAQYVKYHGARDIKTATLVRKPWSKCNADFVAYTTDTWVIFPNEVRETIQTLCTIWKKAGDSPDQIKQQLAQIGFSEPEVALFAHLD